MRDIYTHNEYLAGEGRLSIIGNAHSPYRGGGTASRTAGATATTAPPMHRKQSYNISTSTTTTTHAQLMYTCMQPSDHNASNDPQTMDHKPGATPALSLPAAAGKWERALIPILIHHEMRYRPPRSRQATGTVEAYIQLYGMWWYLGWARHRYI
jgi:hypothetical protein